MTDCYFYVYLEAQHLMKEIIDRERENISENFHGRLHNFAFCLKLKQNLTKYITLKFE